RDLGCLESDQPSIDGQLEIKFHTRANRPYTVVGFPCEPTQSTIDIGIGHAEEAVKYGRKHGISEKAMQRSDVLGFSIQVPATSNEVVALSEEFQKLRNQPEVIGVIGIAHDEVTSLRAVKTLKIRVAVPSHGLVNHAG